MPTPTPLTPLENALLSRFAHSGRSWWLMKQGGDGGAAADLLPMLGAEAGTPGAAWVARVEGRPQQVRYVTGGAGIEHRAGRHLSAVVGPLTSVEAVALLDRAETVRLSTLLILCDLADSGTALEALARPGDTPPAAAPVVVLAEPSAAHAVVGVFGDRPRVMPGVSLVRAPAPVTPAVMAQAEHQRRGLADTLLSRPRGVALLAAVVAVTAASGGSWLALRGAGHDGKPRVSSAPRSLPPVPMLATVPVPQYAPVVVFDPARGNTVAFGGGEPANTPRTWVWAKQGWASATPSASPTDRFGSAAAYDPATRSVLLFGGREIPGGVPNDTWSWDGRTWMEVGLPGPGPPGYEFSGMAWDEAHAQMVLVTQAPDGGGNGVATWTWTGARWRRMLGSAAPPLASSAMAFDPVTRTVLLVTGSIASSVASTWSWDGASWHQLHPAHEPDAGASLARIPGTDQLILAPGTSPSGYAPTWTWDGQDWTAHTRDDLPPVNSTALVADGAAGAVTAFGPNNGLPFGAAWAWTGAHWARLSLMSDPTGAVATVHPGARDFGAVAFDQGRGQLVLYGGQARGVGPTPATVNDTDTWTFAGGLWTRSPTTTHPPSSGPAAYDPGSHQVILVADANGPIATGMPLVRPATWGWDGQAWHALHPSTELPRGSPPLDMVTDPVSRTVVAIIVCCQQSGGALTGSTPVTWTWSGSTWRREGPATQFPAGPQQLNLAFDPSTRRVIGVTTTGSQGAAATWAWNGVTWTELHPAAPAVIDPVTAAMADDPSTGSVVLVETRFQTHVTFNDAGGTLVWNGTTWADNLTAVLPGADTAYGAAAMYEDPVLARLVLVSSTTADFSQEWMWTGLAWLRLALG